MKNWRDYIRHHKKVYKVKTKDKQTKYNDTIYTFDIETTSCVLLDAKINEVDYYDTLTPEERQRAEFYGFMYIWMFGINDEIYYGRTWRELELFLARVFPEDDIQSTIYVHNLAFEMQFLRGVLPIDDVFARQNYSPMYFRSGNLTFRCSYYLTQSPLSKLDDYYNLGVSKKTGDLDYSKIRHYRTPLTDKEYEYCEYDCLVLYELIKKFREQYKHINKIPLTKTGILRKATKSAMNKEPRFNYKMRDLNTYDPDLYNYLVKAFAGGYTHANYLLAQKIFTNVTSFDLCSSYPFVMCCEKVFPTTAWHEFPLKSPDDMIPSKFVYILHCKLKNIRSKKLNTTISFHKCSHISGKFLLDNGRINYMESCELTMTNIDYETYKKFYDFDCEVITCYRAVAGYLPTPFIEYILDIYKKKTELKGVAGKEDEYARAKADFNSLFGMSVTNDIHDEVFYRNDMWETIRLSPEEVRAKLKEKAESKNPFLHFSYGVFITSQARANLLSLVEKYDTYNIYSDTDSLKLREGFDESHVLAYNDNVMKKIEAAKLHTGLDGFTQYDIKGIPHTLGILEKEAVYDKFITIGSKKYAVEGTHEYEQNKEKYYIEGITITVAGVPKKAGSMCLKSIEDFKDGYIFKGTETGKLQKIINNERDINLTITDYLGNTEDVNFSYGLALIPCDYKLSKSWIEDDIEELDMFIPRRLA